MNFPILRHASLRPKSCVGNVLMAIFLLCSMAVTAQELTFVKTNTDLKEVFQEIRRQTGLHVLVESSQINQIQIPQGVSFSKTPVSQVLSQVLAGRGLTWAMQNENTIVVRPIPQQPTAVVVNTTSQPAMRYVSGQVVDPAGKPQTHVTVSNKSGQYRTASSASGHFFIQLPLEETVLVFSSLGFQTQEISIDKITPQAPVVLIPNEVVLDDVVVMGMRDVRRESYTGNAITVSAEEIQQVGQRNIADILQVFDPSFRLENNNLRGSDPNTLPEFYIRGRSGIGKKELEQIDISEAALTNNPNLPIFIMDGYEVTAERVYDYDITRIASMTILKDAAATAIYGSRAANGVIVIQTIPPVPGKLRIDYQVASNLTLPDLSDYNLMNAEEKIRAEELAGLFVGLEGNVFGNLHLNEELLAKKNQLARGVNTDWIAQPLQNALNQKHTLALDGGSQDLRFGVQLRYDREAGVMKESVRVRKGANLNIDYRIHKLQVRNDFSYDIVDAKDSPYGQFSDYTQKNPYDEFRDENGKLLRHTRDWRAMSSGFVNTINPLYEALEANNFRTNGYHSLTNNTSLIWRPWTQFQVRGDLAVTRVNKRSDDFVDPTSSTVNPIQSIFIDPSTLGRLTIGRTDELQLNSNLTFNYMNTIGKNHLNFSGGVNLNESTGTQISEFYSGFPSGHLNSPNYAERVERKPTYVDNITRLIGTFVALNYTYHDIYLLDLSGRVDGSSSFGSEQRFAPFWSMGAGINFHNYNFLKNNSIFNRIKLAGSFGQLGKTNFPPYASRGTYTIQQRRYSTGVGTLLKAMENPYLTWEKTNTYDLVLDLSMLNNRVQLNANWYNKVTRDLVNDVDMPISSGFLTYKENVGKIENKGYEIAVRTDVYRSRTALVGLFVNFASNRNTLLELSNSLKRYNELVDQQYDGFTPGRAISQDPSIKNQYSTAHTKYIEGGSVTSIFGMRSLGINPADGQEVYLRPDGTVTYDWSASDQVIIGDPTAKGQGSFGLNATYKGLSLYATFMYEFGGQSYNYTLLNKVENVDLLRNNADKRVLTERWQQPGDLTPLKDIAARLYTSRPTSRFIQDKNEIKFNSISLSYDIDRSKINHLGLERLRLQAMCNDLATFSSIMQERGLHYPFSRTFSLTVKAVF